MQYSITVNQRNIPTDAQGYLLDWTLWDEAIAVHIAENEGISMSTEHWEVVNFVRSFYEEYDTSPAIRALVNAMKLQFGAEKGSSRYVQRLFPKGPAKQATKIAGLPKPAKCL